AAQSEVHAGRFADIGMDTSRIQVTGSIKFDVKLPVSIKEEAAVIRRQWGVNRSVWIAASTHEGEEETVLRAFHRVREALPNALLVLVPRHPERFVKVANLCRRYGFQVVLRSEGRACADETAVFIGDSMGELVVFYAAADAAFVGGTLVTVGGHNILEPAALGIPVVTGPYFHNFEEITEKLRAAGACRQIEDEQQLSDTVIDLLKDADLRFAMGEKGRQIVADNRGALQAVLGLIARQLAAATDHAGAAARAVNEG
ncbi:MAG TPA: glycosyltransferase, partial [Gammaproteobacteria bacterium]|nr:glycosyltransferase [Gammaproteobacteria bacterium]